jgi:cell wall-associated NlpC family hydrolase
LTAASGASYASGVVRIDRDPGVSVAMPEEVPTLSSRPMFRPDAPRWGLVLFFLLVVSGDRFVLAQESPAAATAEAVYRSPYRVEFRAPLDTLIGDLERTERGDPHRESVTPFDDWYGPRLRARYGAWGPVARHYPAPEGWSRWSAEFCRERVIAVALRYVGYEYQHHHIPDWCPPPSLDWPWKPVAAGHNGRGVDCSNFTGFVYNQGFGLKISTDVVEQSRQRVADGPGAEPRRETPVQRVELPDDYQQRIAALRTGDLLYIRGKPGGEVTHVVLWVGPIGKSPDATPLVLDSHGADVKDSQGQMIPAGVHLRPFRENSWYNRCASHAHRIFGE